MLTINICNLIIKSKSYKYTICKDGRWAMRKYLSVGEFKLLTRDKIDGFDVNVVR